MRKVSLLAGLIVATPIIYGSAAATLPIPPIAPAPSYRTVASMEMTVAGESANLREKPTTTSKILEKLPKDTKVVVTEQVSGGKWAHVQVNGKDGYILSKLLK